VRRRDFIKTAAGSLAAWPLVARAQQPTMPVVGYLGAETPERFGIRLTAFRQGLSDMGYDEGRNVQNRISLGEWSEQPAAGAGR
jgi:putative ABC transport system substrate-binding protein